MQVTRRTVLASSAAALIARPAFAQQDVIKVGVISSQTGPFAAVGRQMMAGIRLYMQEHGDVVAGKKVEIVLRDDAGVADQARRQAQELVASGQAQFLAGFTLTPAALAAAPIATQAKTPMVVMVGATSIIPDRSPFIVRSHLSVPQFAVPYGRWIAEQQVKTLITLVADYGPGQDYEGFLSQGFQERGGKVIANLRVPLASPDFAPFLQRVANEKPDALFIFVPAGGVANVLMKQIKERGLVENGIKLFAETNIVDDELVDSMGDVAIGAVTIGAYSSSHDSDKNRKFVEAFRKQNNVRPNIVGVAGYDGMHFIYEALRKTNGSTDGTKNLQAMMDLEWESPRGPVKLDPTTRDLIQNAYVRRTERAANGEMQNIEFATIPMVKDPTRPAKP